MASIRSKLENSEYATVAEWKQEMEKMFEEHITFFEERESGKPILLYIGA